jgi:uncharacterized protein YndB with AHSA1/START domain
MPCGKARQVGHSWDGAENALALQADFPGVPPMQLFEYWTRPELLVRWWPSEGEIEAREGGHYHFSWPGPGWHLRGSLTRFDPGRGLALTWKWDHDPDDMTRTVDVTFAPLDDGTRLDLVHGSYSDDETGREERQSHHDGWTHFLGRLREVTSAPKGDEIELV